MLRWWKHLKKLDKEEYEQYKEQIDKENLTAKDKFSMILSAFLVIVLPVSLGLIGFGVLILALFGAFG
ncbi:MAG TPA: hypothetical protein IAD47_01515 [Candidatus Limihabitans stercoravium]|nr:hypothetical protein [Candidatus Limihabitans stercoravium]